MKFNFRNVILTLVLLFSLAAGLQFLAQQFGGGVSALAFIALLSLGIPKATRALGVGSAAYARQNQDLSLTLSPALPNGNVTVFSTALKVGPGVHPEKMEFLVTIPAVGVGAAPNGATLTVDIVCDDAATPTTAASLQAVFTGAGGVGFAGATFRLKISDLAGDYVRLRMAGSATFGNASAQNATFALLT